MYDMWQVTKPNGERLAFLAEADALQEAQTLSAKAGDQEVLYYAMKVAEDNDENPGEERVVYVKRFKRGNVEAEGETDWVQAAEHIPAPGKASKKTGMTAEQKAAKDAEKAEKKRIKDEEKAARATARAEAKEVRDRERAEKRAQREADKANRPARGPRSKLPDDGIVHLLREGNPKRPGTACYPRFDLYKEGMTVKEYKELNKDFGSVDLAWDIDHGFIKVTNADGSDLVPVAPIGNGAGPTEPEASPAPAVAEGEPSGIPA